MLKALTGKYTPLKQWVGIRIKIYSNDNKPLHNIQERYEQYTLSCLLLLIIHFVYSSLDQFVIIIIRQNHFFVQTCAYELKILFLFSNALIDFID